MTILVLARMSIWHFKEGKREGAFTELDSILSSLTRDVGGFRGYLSMLSHDDPNLATILTLWQDEEALKASEKGVFTQANTKVQDSLASDTKIENFMVFSTELFMHTE